jgi:glycosyltransferase involved in cell wall biosynthesis
MKVIFISSMLPSGHFSQILTGAIAKDKNIELIVYTDKNQKNKQIRGCGTIKNVWEKNILYIVQIIRNILRDQPDVIHIQQEFNMYGSVITAALFPFLPFLLKLAHQKVVVTIHAAVYKRQVTPEFISLFTSRKSPYLNTVTLKLFFMYVYKLTSIFADRIICHTYLLKDILVQDYGVNPSKISVIPTPVPKNLQPSDKKSNYFFYFGYIVRRKGLEYILQGFKKFVAKHPHYKLILAGGTIPGQEDAYREVIDLIKRLGIEDTVELKGFVEEKELRKLYTSAIAVLIPAKVSMGSSGPLYHAQSYGKCVLVSKVGHFLEDVTHLKDGMLVENDAWEQAMKYAIKHPGVIKNIERNVYAKAKQKNPFNIGQSHIKVYKEIQHAGKN